MKTCPVCEEPDCALMPAFRLAHHLLVGISCPCGDQDGPFVLTPNGFVCETCSEVSDHA